MSHFPSPPQKTKGENKSHGLPRGSERWVGLGEECSRRVPEGRVEWGGVWGKTPA